MSEEPVSYTEVEIESYLPSGWTLAPGTSPAWDARGRKFRFAAIDTSDLDWQLAISPAEVQKHGRIEALRKAVDELNRMRFKSIL